MPHARLYAQEMIPPLYLALRGVAKGGNQRALITILAACMGAGMTGEWLTSYDYYNIVSKCETGTRGHEQFDIFILSSKHLRAMTFKCLIGPAMGGRIKADDKHHRR